MQRQTTAAIPMQMVGPIKLAGGDINDSVMVPMATYESPLWPSTNRGARVSRLSGGIKAVVVSDKMTRSVVLEALDINHANSIITGLNLREEELREVAAQGSRFTKLVEWNWQVVGNLLYLRFSFVTGDAAGHNMATAAAERLLNWLLREYTGLRYVSISGNYCIDKKASAVNGILGRGKYVVAEILISREICHKTLRTTPEQIVDLNTKKNLIGTMLAGGIRSANAHFANMLLAIYLATGQDAANIIEGSQGMVHAEVRAGDLYFSVTLPNLIVGTIGNGKHLEFAQQNLAAMGCMGAGDSARRLAVIIAAAVLCGELSLLAAQTNPGELMKMHLKLERASDKANCG